MQQAKKEKKKKRGGWKNRTDRCYLNDAGAHDTNKVFRTWLITDGISKQWYDPGTLADIQL